MLLQIDSSRTVRYLLHIAGIFLCLHLSVQNNLTDDEKLTLFKKKTSGVPLPDFAFFTKKSQNAYSRNILRRTEKKRLNQPPFVQNYDVTAATSLANQLKTVLESGAAKRNNGPAGIDEEISVDSIFSRSRSTNDMKKVGSMRKGSLHSYTSDQLKSRLDVIKHRLDHLKRQLAHEQEVADMIVRSRHSRRKDDFEHYVHRITKRETSELLACDEKGSETTNGYLRFCKQCAYKTTLDSDKYPRYINEIKCDTTDTSCLCGEGSCFQKVIYTTFMQTLENGTSIEYSQAINNGCDCELAKGSIFESYLT